jgi:hypothetical protein
VILIYNIKNSYLYDSATTTAATTTAATTITAAAATAATTAITATTFFRKNVVESETFYGGSHDASKTGLIVLGGLKDVGFGKVAVTNGEKAFHVQGGVVKGVDAEDFLNIDGEIVWEVGCQDIGKGSGVFGAEKTVSRKPQEFPGRREVIVRLEGNVRNLVGIGVTEVEQTFLNHFGIIPHVFGVKS